jgi:hypothetical protein
MKQRVEKKVPLGLLRKPKDVVGEIEKTTEDMVRQGWSFLYSETDVSLKNVSLFFEREINA